MGDMIRCLIVGRFQPFHKGHLHVLRRFYDEFDELIIGIGSAQYSHTFENPFTSGERYLMIRESLRDEGLLEKCHILPIPDTNCHPIWVSSVESYLPPFNSVITNNSLNKLLFEQRGYEVISIPLYKRKIYCGTVIRNRIALGKKWTHLVAEKAVEIIKEIDGEKRIRMLFSSAKD